MVDATPWTFAEVRALVEKEGAQGVARALLDRRDVAPELSAWISCPSADELVARAAAIDARLAAGEALPLAGVPFAVKDNIDVAGIATTAGCTAFAHTATVSAPAVQALLDAGALFAGKTNLDQFATGLVGTRSPAYGPCRNPLDPDIITGGSSSGSAAVVATGEVAFALGTDTAGSGRIPAALCGVVGAKPAPGVVSTEGVVPAMRSLDCVSVFTGTAVDAAAVLDAWGLLTPDSATQPPPIARIGLPAAIDWHGDDDARECFQRAVAAIASLVPTVVDVDATPIAAAGSLVYGSALVAERSAAFGEFADAHPDAMDPAVLDIVRRAGEHSASDFARALESLAALRGDVARAWWQHVDALLVPTVARVPSLAEALADPFGPSLELGQLTAFANPLGLAVVAVPLGTRATGLPFGVSLVGPAGTEAAMLALAAQLTGDDPAPVVDPLAVRPHRIVVVGAHLQGQPLNHQLTDVGALCCATTTTAADYRLYALDTTPPKPGLRRVAAGSGAAIEVEVWALDASGLGTFVAGIPSPLGVGKVVLADGTEETGFLCEPFALEGARDITAFGGWRAYLEDR